MKTQKLMLFLLSFSMAIFFISCDNNNSSVKEDVEKTSEEMSEMLKQEREELATDIDKLRQKISQRTTALQKDLEHASEEAKVEINAQIAQLEEWGENLDESTESLGDDLSDGWQNFKAETRKTMKSIDQEFQKLFSGSGQ